MDDISKLPVEGSETAPIIYFDGAPVYGVGPGTGRIALEALVQEPLPDGGVRWKRVIVAHLRGGAVAFETLRNAINGMEVMIAGPKEGDAVN